MKSITAGLTSHYAQEVTTLALLFKVTRKDGTVFRFTSHDKELEFESETYLPLNAFSPTAVSTSAGMAVDNLDAMVIIDGDTVTESDLRAGLFRYADFIIREVNWKDVSLGSRIIRAGNLGEITINKSGTFVAEARGVLQPLQETYGRVYGLCDADLGDTRCGFNLSSRQQSGVVTAVATRGLFSVNGVADDTFIGGKVTWTSGLNNGLAMEVKNWTGSPSDTVELFEFMPFNIAAGDTFTITPGCAKTLTDCRDNYDNVVNHRGHPFIPGRDAILSYPDSPS